MARDRRSPQPANRFVTDEARLALEDALSVLSLETRAAVWLHVVEGEGVPEIADCLRNSRSTVSRRIGCGLANLRTTMEHRGHAPPTTSAVMVLLRELPQPEPPSTLDARLREVAERIWRRTHGQVL